MVISELLKGVDCQCGRHHTCAIRHVYIEHDAISHLTELCQGYEKILVVADENTYGAAGAKVDKALTGMNVEKLIFPGSELLIPNEDAIAAVTAKLGDNKLIVGIGSGVIQDLCKYVSFESGIPYYIVATAPSMDGYAGTGAAMITGGMKVTYTTKVPEAIIADTEVLKDAPMEMIKAGYGDIIGKYSALNDWKLSHVVNGEYFCQFIYDLTWEMLQKTQQLADGLVLRDEQSVQALMEALVGVGIAMSFAGTSRPASGSEHHFSHYFEITGIVNDEPYLCHGIDVAYSTILTSQIREKLLGSQFPETQFTPDRKEYEQDLERIYKSVGASCVALQDKLGTYEKNRAPIYKAYEQEIKAILAEIPGPKQIQEILGKVGLDIQEFYDLYSAEKLKDAVVYAKDLKDRYTVLWMYYDMFGKTPL